MAPFGEMNEATSGWLGHGPNHIQIDSDLGDFLTGGTKPYRKSKDELIAFEILSYSLIILHTI